MRSAIRVVGTVLLTAVLAWLGLLTGRGAGGVPAVWWANAALLSLMLLETAGPAQEPATGRELLGDRYDRSGGARRLWPTLLAAGYAGNFPAHLLIGDPIVEGLALSACDIGETAIAAYGVGFGLGGGVDLTDERQLLRFVGFAVILAPLAASAAAGLVLRLLASSSLMVGLRWFPPSALGMSILPPLVLGLAGRPTWELIRPAQRPNTLLYMLAIGLGTTAILWRSEFALLFLLVPPLLFLVVRLGLSGGALGCCVVATIGTLFTVGRRSGAFTAPELRLEQPVLMLQLFLGTAVLSSSVLGVVLAQLKRATRDVRESELRYRSLAASMEMLATLDPLTRLANRRRFDEALEVEWQRASRVQSTLSLVLVDADYFKFYNDYYGPLAGDECLKRIAETMNALARRPADVVARVGGDEFGMVLPGTNADGARTMAESLRQRIADLGIPHPASPAGQVTVSAGCATVIPTTTQTSAVLLDAADSVLYSAKHKGRNRVEIIEIGSSNRLGV